MGEMGNFLYGQVVVRSGLKQFFGRSLFTVNELCDVRVGAVHAGAVLQLVHGIAPAVDAEASLVPVICGEEKRLFFPRRFRLLLFFYRFRHRYNGSGLFLFDLFRGGRNGFLPHVVLNVFRPYFFDLVRHHVEQRQLAGIVLAPSGHNVPVLI